MSADEAHQNGLAHSSSDEESGTTPPAEERTLTDHLNKKLLESFLNRLDEGEVQVPHSNQSSNGTTEESDDADFDN